MYECINNVLCTSTCAQSQDYYLNKNTLYLCLLSCIEFISDKQELQNVQLEMQSTYYLMYYELLNHVIVHVQVSHTLLRVAANVKPRAMELKVEKHSSYHGPGINRCKIY